MPINPNIALGVQPQQQPNMLGQLGQMMAIKAAQQELEGSEDVRNAFARGAPEDPTQLLRYGKQGRAAYESLLKGRKEQLESAEKRLTMTGQIAGYVRDNPTPENFTSAVSNMVQNGVLTRAQAERVIADAGNDPTKIKTYAERAMSDAISAVDKMRDTTTQRGQNLSHSAAMAGVGATLRGQDLTDARARAQLEFERNRRNVIASEGGYSQTDPYGNIYRVEGYGALRGPNAAPVAAAPVGGGGAPALPPAAANAFVTTQPSINALAPTAAPQVSQPGAPTVANAAAIERQANIPRPPARAGYRYDETTGKLVKVPDEKPVWNEKAQVWMTPPTAENPQGKVVEAPAVQEAVQKKAANQTLKIAGFNERTGANEVSELIKKSTSGLGENVLSKIASSIGWGTEGAQAIAKLETRANELTLGLAPNGSLGAGFSNDDRLFMLGKLGDVANPNKPVSVRLAAWEDVMERAARTAGVNYPRSLGASSAPALTGEDKAAMDWANANPKDPRAAKIKQRLGG